MMPQTSVPTPTRRASKGRRGFPRSLIGLVWVAAFLFLCACVGRGITAQEPTDDDQRPILYRKVYVPEQEIHRFKGVYYPIQRKEFQEHVDAIRNRQATPGASLLAGITEGTYTAKLVGDQLVDGTAELSILHKAEVPAAVLLEPCDLAIDEPVWRPVGADGSTADTTNPVNEVKVGLDDASKTAAVVKTSGVLQFSWSLRGRREPSGRLAFDLRLPPSPVNQLALAIPLGLKPTLPNGFASKIQDSESDDTHNVWSIRFSGDSSGSLYISPEDATQEMQQLVLLRQHATYRFSTEGIDVSVDLHLDIHNEPLDQLSISLDPTLQLVDAACDKTQLSWTEAESPDTREVVLEFAEPISGIDCLVRLRALAGRATGTRQRLPGVYAHEDEVLWLEGKVDLEVSHPLSLEYLTADGGRQSSVSPLPDPEEGERLQIQYFRPKADVDVIIGRRDGEIIVHQGTTIRLGSGAASAVQVADFESTGSQQFLLEMETTPIWTIDLLETVPPDLIDEWVPTRESGQKLIQIRLREALSSERGLRVRVHGRAIRRNMRLDGRELRFGVFRDVNVARSLVAVGADAPKQVRLGGDAELTRLAASQLTEKEAELLAPLAGGAIYVDDRGADDLTVAASSDAPNYAAELNIDSHVLEKSVEHEFHIRCVPESSSIAELLVHFSESWGGEFLWEFVGESDAAPVARRLTTEGQPSEVIRGGETWRVSLPRQQDAEFELVAKGTAPFDSESSIPLVSLPGAASQTGTLRIRSPATIPIRIRQQKLRAIPPAPLAPDRYATIRGVFRYEPSEESRVSVVRRDRDTLQALAWVWSCQLTSRFCPDGQAVHEAVYRIENTGASQLEMTPPHGSEVIEAFVDGRKVPLPIETSRGEKLVMPLPRDVRFPTAIVQFATQGESLGPLSAVSAQWPRTDLPVFRREWIAWLPPGYDRLETDGGQGGVSWHRRLFGPLLRSEHRDRFNPFSQDHWQSLGAEVNAQQTDGMHDQTNAFLQGLAQELDSLQTGSIEAPSKQQDGPQGVAEEASPLMTWGSFLTACVQKLEKPDHAALPAILVDGDSLAQIGISARTPVDRSAFGILQPQGADATASGSAKRGARLLESANLALVSHENRLLLTTAEALACRAQRCWRNAACSVAVGIDSAGWDHLTRNGTEPCVVPLAAWAAEPYLPRSCWSIAPLRPHASVGDDGWTAHIVSVSSRGNGETGAGEVTHLRVRQPQTMQAFGWAAFLASLGLVLWIVRRRVLLGIPLIAVAGSIALLVPDGFAPIFTGCFLGTLLAVPMVFAWSARTRIVPQPTEADASSSAVVRVELTCLILAAAIPWLNAANVLAQETTTKEPLPNDRQEIHRVLCPVDEDRKPWGENLFVPPELFDALHRKAAPTEMAFGKWMIYAADYRAILHYDVAEDELSATELVATYQLDVFQPGTRVRLPIDQKKVYLLPNRARLDGNEASISWEPGGKGLSIEVETAGTYKIELAFRPIIEGTDDKAGFDIEIPPVVRSQLTLEVPDEARSVEFPTAFGTVEHNQDGQQVVNLGPTDRLAVQWPIDPDVNAYPSNVAVDQLMWLKVRASSVVLDTRFKFSTVAGRIERVQLLADPRLRILPPAGDQPIAGYHVPPGETKTILLDIKPPYQQELAFDVRFVLTETASVGNVRLPRLEAVADHTNRRWLGVSVAPDLEFDPPERTVEDPPSAADFAAAWGQVDELPQVVTRVADGQPDWSLATRPREPKITASQRLIVSLTQERVDFRFDADIQISDGSRFQYRITVPKQFKKSVEVTSVSVVEEDAERLARWSRDEHGNVIVRLNKPVSQPHRLQLRGKIAFPWFRRSRTAIHKTAVPRIVLADATLSSDRVELYRRPKVAVDVTNKTGFVDAADVQLGSHAKDLGRLAAALDGLPDEPKPAAIQVDVSANRPSTFARIVTTLTRREDAWQADADCVLNVRDGVVDTLRLEIPPEWKGPFELDTEAQVETIEVPGQNRRYLVLRPSQAIERPYHIRVRGTLSATTGERVRAPDIVPLDVGRAERYLIAPTSVQNRQIAWETRGLQAATLPAGYGEPDIESYVCYRAVPRRFQATIKDVQLESGIPRVTLTDIHIDFDRDGSVLGVATFDLEPAGLSECRLELPAGYEPVHVTVANLPVEPDRPEDGRWRLPLGPRQLPQQIQVLFTGYLEPALLQQAPPVLRAPCLAGIAAEQTLWTVRGPSSGSIELVDKDNELDPFAHELLRLEQHAKPAVEAADVLAESDASDIDNWYGPWARRYAASRARAVRWQAASAFGSDQSSAALDAVEVQHGEIAERLDAGELKSQSESESWHAVELADVWRIACDRPRATGRGTFAGTRDRILVRHRFEANDAKIERLAAVTVMAGIVVIAFLLLPHPVFANGIGRYPQLLGILLGIVWWVWFAPSFLGWTIVLISALSLVAAAFRRGDDRQLVADHAAAE